MNQRLTATTIERIKYLTLHASLMQKMNRPGQAEWADKTADKLFDAVRNGRFGMCAWMLYA